MDARLDKYLTNDNRVQVVLKLAHDTIERLQRTGTSLSEKNIERIRKLESRLREDNVHIWEPPLTKFKNEDPTPFLQYGILFCELLEGKLLPAKANILRGAFFLNPMIDYLATIIPNGEMGGAGMRMWVTAQEIIDPSIFWISENNKNCRVNKYKDAIFSCYGIPDLVISVKAEWRDEAYEFARLELYELPEYWFIDPDAQTIYVYRHDGTKLAPFGIFRQGDTFTSKVLDDKTVEASLFLQV